MHEGFPAFLLPLVCCSIDGAALRPDRVTAPTDHLTDESLTCAACARVYPISKGILNLLTDRTLHPESAREMQRRDEKAEAVRSSGGSDWRSGFSDRSEVQPTLAALGDIRDKVVVELGCGTGRYTIRLAAEARAVLAIDFSYGSLESLRAKLPSSANVGLVQADVTTLQLAPRSFDRMLSTLHSNLPTAEHRRAAIALGAKSLAAGGRYVISMHYHGLRERLRQEPQAGHYPGSGIYRYHVRRDEAIAEVGPYFESLAVVLIHASIPGLPIEKLSMIASKLPVLREFSRLMLAIAERPRADPPLRRVST